MTRADYERRYAEALHELLEGAEGFDRHTATLHRTEHETFCDLVFSVAQFPGFRFGISDEIWSDRSPPQEEPEFAAELMRVSLDDQLEADDRGLPANPRPDGVNWLAWARQSTGQPAPDRG